MKEDKNISKEVLIALEKMEIESANIKAAQRREVNRLKKARALNPVVPEIKREVIIKQQNMENHLKTYNELKWTLIILAATVFTVVMLMSGMSENEKKNFIQNGILFCVTCSFFVVRGYQR